MNLGAESSLPSVQTIESLSPTQQDGVLSVEQRPDVFLSKETEQEAEWYREDIPEEKRFKPNDGHIEFKKYSTRYR